MLVVGRVSSLSDLALFYVRSGPIFLQDTKLEM